MSSEYSDDQYRADYESRYPQYSDYQLTDKSIAERKWDRPAQPRGVYTYESQYQTEQMGVPTYHGCTRDMCPHSEWPKQVPMRKCDLDQREYEMYKQYGRTCMPPPPMSVLPSVQPSEKSVLPSVTKPGTVESMLGAPSFGLEPMSILIMFMFIMFIFICYCMKTIVEIKAQLKSISRAT